MRLLKWARGWWRGYSVPAVVGPERHWFPGKQTLDQLFHIINEARGSSTQFTAEQRRRLDTAKRCLRRAIKTKNTSYFFDALTELRLVLCARGHMIAKLQQITEAP